MSVSSAALSCPIPKSDYARISIAHGGGGRLTQDLIRKIFLPAFGNAALEAQGDAAQLDLPSARIAITTDSYVVRPLFFPGGDIGTLAVNGTVNDLAVSGATPRALSAAFILEEGLEIETLWRVALSMRAAADAACDGPIPIVAGDTKVIERGSAEPGLMIAMTGIGERIEPAPSPARIREGAAILVSGPIGDHGMAVMSAREGLEFESPIRSDCAPLFRMASALLATGGVQCMRDLTRGGLSSALNELAESSGLRFAIDEAAAPVRAEVRAACEIFGIDPMYVACEGRLVAFVERAAAAAALGAMRACEGGEGAAIIGAAEAGRPEVVVLTRFGALRPLDMLSGEQLPRIC